MLVNAARSRFRRRTAEIKVFARLGEPTHTVPPPSTDAQETWDAVRTLPARQAQVIALRFYDRRRIGEIAQILGCSENSVKTHLLRAKETLARTLGEQEAE